MARAVVVVFAGAIAGAALAALVHNGSAQRNGSSADGIPTTDSAETQVESGQIQGVQVPAHFEAGMEAARASSGIDSYFDVEEALTRAANAPPSSARDAEIAALLDQYAVQDPREAVMFAERFELDSRYIDKLFRDWAAEEPDAALQGLLLVRSNVTRRSAALSLLDVFGHDEAATERIAAVFPRVESRAFTVDAISKRAESDFSGAIEAAEGYVGWNFVPLSRIADVAARLNPEFGMESSGEIDVNRYRRRYRDRLLDEWAKLDPAAMLDWLETADLSEQTQAALAFRAAAAYSPERLLEVATNFGPSQAQLMRRAAVEELMQRDAVTAFDTINALPPSADKDSLLNRVAAQYANESPYEAMAWIQAQEPRSQLAFNAVMTGLARVDPLLAIDAIIAETIDPVAANRAEMPPLANVLSAAVSGAEPGELVQLINRVASHPDYRVNSQLEIVVRRWANDDPSGAAEWALAAGSDVSLASMESLAMQIASRDPDLAMRTIARLPESRQGPWIVGAAAGIAASDFDAAMSFVSRYQDAPLYDSTLANVLQRGANSNPVAVAAMIDRVPPEQAGNVAMSVASSWSRQDPVAAANWIRDLPDVEDSHRHSAYNSVATTWASSDERAARRWVLDLDEGAARDAGIRGLITAASSSGSLDRQLLDMLSTDSARADGVFSAVFALGRSDPALGQELIDEYISDPERRQLAEQRLSQGSGAGSQVIYLPNGGGTIMLQNGNMIMMQ